MTDVMIDLETFGLGPTAAIVQVGAVRFDPASTVEVNPRFDDTFQRTVLLQSAVLAGGTVDPGTIEWWRKQSIAARDSITDLRRETGLLEVVLADFTKFLGPDAIVWSHGAAFDLPILEMAYRSVGIDTPWDHRSARDTRTIFWLAETLAGWSKPTRETAHTALADAVAQAEDVRTAYRALRDRIT